ncbi:MAG: bifunctional sugar-1-phosphate nucleotidylyltransferase/acetyltransferase [Patescibacteria group bacterium]
MQAVILAAGKSSRFSPYNESFSHKSLVSVMGKPILIHTIESVVRSGIKEIILVVSEDSEIKKILGDGNDYGARIDYVVQEDPTGAGNGLLLTEKLIRGDFFLLNASRVDFDEYKDRMLVKKNGKVKVVLVGKNQDEVGKYGVLKVEEDRVLDLIEKPSRQDAVSNIRLIGTYLFSKDFFKTLRDTPDEHYKLENAISISAKNGDVKIVLTSAEAPSLKYSWDILEVKNFLLSKIKGKSIKKNSKIAKSAEIIGDVIIEDNVTVMEGAKIKGPCFIGKNSTIGNNAIIRGGTDIEGGCTVGAYMEVKNTLIMKNSKAHSGFIGDSVVGEDVRIGAQFATANVRLDRKSVKTKIKDEKIDTHLRSLGTIIGNNVKVGIKCSTMPGVIIGENSVIGPSTVIQKNVASNTKYYSKFQEIITEK